MAKTAKETEEKPKRVGQIFRESLIQQIKDNTENSNSTFIVGYSNLDGFQITSFRKDLKKVGAKMTVSKNRLAKLALKDLDQAELAEAIDAQAAFVWSDEDSVSVSKVLVDFEKDNETFKVKGGLLDGRALQKSDVKTLADLPSKDVLQAMLLQTMLAPLTRLASALNAKSRDLLSILNQLSEQKGGSNDG